MATKEELEAEIVMLKEIIDILQGDPGDMFYDDRLLKQKKIKKLKEKKSLDNKAKSWYNIFNK